jgi:hypothetical protein
VFELPDYKALIGPLRNNISGAKAPRPPKIIRPRGTIWMHVASGLAQGLSVDQVCRECGVTRATVMRWCKAPKFNSLVDRYRDDYERQYMQFGLAQKHARVQRLQKHLDRIEGLIDAGGLMAEGSFDASLSKELRATLEQVAKEFEFNKSNGINVVAGDGATINVAFVSRDSVTQPATQPAQADVIDVTPESTDNDQ